jgi:hypothetical protein
MAANGEEKQLRWLRAFGQLPLCKLCHLPIVKNGMRRAAKVTPTGTEMQGFCSAASGY